MGQKMRFANNKDPYSADRKFTVLCRIYYGKYSKDAADKP